MGIIESRDIVAVSRETEKELVDLFRKISPRYARYLTIFNLFDPHSLGTVSEVILTKLLKDEGLDVEHTGKQQGITDIRMGDTNISLKTTKSKTPINLGSDSKNVSRGDLEGVATFMSDENFKQLFLDSGMTLGDMLSTQETDFGGVGNEKEIKDSLVKLETRIESIINKISGKENTEEFVWVEKVYDDNFLGKIIIHVSSYDRDKVRDLFYTMVPYSTGKAWGLQTVDGVKMIQADSIGKQLNIKPAFIYETISEDKQIPIDIPVKDMKLDDPKSFVNDKMFSALEAMYNELFT